MDKNFKIRVICGLTLFLLASLSLPLFDSIIFKIFFAIFAIISVIELLSFFKNKKTSLNIFLAICEIIFLILGTIYIFKHDCFTISTLIFGVCGYDVFAYFFGRMFGGKIFRKSRPFPHISKNKTWEGTIFGLLASCFLVWALFPLTGEYLFFLCGPLALVGDLAESAIKRSFNVKDSNENVIKNKFFAKIELLVGGSEGHGGYLDRLDSLSFTAAILLILSLFI